MEAAVRQSGAVVNCVGILAEAGRQRFEAIHVDGASRIARAAAREGAERMVHISAIGANPDGPSRYGVTKAAGEAAVAAEFPSATILRPSVIFGAEDQFFNRFGFIARNSPVVPLVGASTRFQPVYVDDVARAVLAAAAGSGHAGVHELGGPEICSFQELIERMLKVIRRNRLIINLPAFAARPLAGALGLIQLLSGGLIVNRTLTLDQIAQLGVDNVVSEGARGLAEFGIEPVAIDAVLESYLYRFRPAGQYTAIQESAELLRDGR